MRRTPHARRRSSMKVETVWAMQASFRGEVAWNRIPAPCLIPGAGVRFLTARGLLRLPERQGGLDVGEVRERLGEVAQQLALLDVVLLAEQAEVVRGVH